MEWDPFTIAWLPPTYESATFDAYAKALKEALESLQTVTNVEIANYGPFQKFPEGAPLPDWGKGEVYYPPLQLFDFRFEVFIARRLQEGLLREDQFREVTDAERFFIHQIYVYGSPITFVRPLKMDSEFEPAMSVCLVREYFRNLPVFMYDPTLDFGGDPPSLLHPRSQCTRRAQVH